jgi:hypothetical protein
MKKNFDFFGIVLAREGDGKSTFAMECASYFDPDFSIDNIIMTDNDWMKVHPKLHKGMALIFDEGSEIAFSRDAMKREQKDFMKLLTQIRGIGLFMLFCISDIKNADRFLRERRAFALFYIPKRGEMWCYRLFGKNPLDERKITETRKRIMNGEFPMPNYRNHFTPMTGQLWDEYVSKKKLPFMKRDRESKLVRKMRERIEKKLNGSATVADIKKMFQVSYVTAYAYINKYRFVPKKYLFKDFQGRIRVAGQGIDILRRKITAHREVK